MVLFVFVIFICPSFTYATGLQTSPTSLRQGNPIEREIKLGQTQTFGIALDRDRFLKLIVDQRGIDVVINVASPEGKSMGRFDSPNGSEGPEDVSFVSHSAGTYRIELAPLQEDGNTISGRYEIRIVELRAATRQELDAVGNKEILRQKGLALLVEIVDSLKQIRQPDTRARAQLMAGQMLWESDEKHARELWQDAIQGAKQYLASAAEDDENYGETLQRGLQLRSEIVQWLAPRDPEMALSFIRSTNIMSGTSGGDNSGFLNQELQLELAIANQIVAKDPKQALQIAENSLKRGYAYNLTNILLQLRRSDPGSAAKLAEEILTKVQNENFLNNQEVSNLAVNLLSTANSRWMNGRQGDGAKPEAADDSTLLSEQEYRDLLQKLLSAVGSNSVTASAPYSQERNSAQNILNSLTSMQPIVERLAPGSSAEVAKRTSLLAASNDPSSSLRQKFVDAVGNGSVDEALVAAGKAPQDMREQLFRQIAEKASAAGNDDLAIQILTDHVPNPVQRQDAIRNLRTSAFYRAIQKGDIEDAFGKLALVHSPSQRAQLLAELLTRIGNGQSKATALRLLETARAMFGASTRAENQAQMNTLLAFSAAFARIGSDRGFEVIQPLVDQLNEMSAAAVTLDGFGQKYYQEGELILRNGNSVGNVTSQLISTIAQLASLDFDRAKKTAAGMQQPEVRLAAFLAIAQAATAK
jgi:hypothetical protein